MTLHGSCHCQAVTFTVQSQHYYPYQRCYCSICRKTAGSGGFAINLSAAADTLEVKGRDHINTYHARLVDEDSGAETTSDGERAFCRHCGSALWVYDPNWPELLHPHAGAIDTALPEAPEQTHVLLDSKAPWVKVDAGPDDRQFEHYPDESIADWHTRVVKR